MSRLAGHPIARPLATSALARGALPSPTMLAANARLTHADPIDLGVGEPDGAPPPLVEDAVRRALREGVRYGPAAGSPRLRALIAEDQERSTGLPRAAEETLVTAGGKPALADALRCLVDPGDEVLVPAPYWPSFLQQVHWAGGSARVVPPSVDLSLDPDAIDAACGPRTRGLILCNPSNPTSLALDAGRLQVLARICERRGLWLLVDQVYGQLDLDGRGVPLLRAVPELGGRTVVVESFSKRFAMTGFRLGYACGPPQVIQAMERLAMAQSTCTSALAQAAGIAALSLDDSWIDARRAEYRERRELARRILASVPGLTCAPTDAAFYLFPRLPGDAPDDRAFATTLRAEGGVSVVPGSAFGAPGHVRISYAGPAAELERGLQRVAAHVVPGRS